MIILSQSLQTIHIIRYFRFGKHFPRTGVPIDLSYVYTVRKEMNVNQTGATVIADGKHGYYNALFPISTSIQAA